MAVKYIRTDRRIRLYNVFRFCHLATEPKIKLQSFCCYHEIDLYVYRYLLDLKTKAFVTKNKMGNKSIKILSLKYSDVDVYCSPATIYRYLLIM